MVAPSGERAAHTLRQAQPLTPEAAHWKQPRITSWGTASGEVRGQGGWLAVGGGQG